MKTRPPEYGVWTDMRRRCLSEVSVKYADYGGRGIGICEQWSSFDQFMADMGSRPSQEHSLERRDNEKGYSLENCRWATWKEQANNRRSSRLLTHDGKTQTMSQWAKELGVKYATLKNRICKLGWSTERALARPVGRWEIG